MSKTDPSFDAGTSAPLGTGDLDMTALEHVSAAARDYAGATERLADAYTSYVQAVRALSTAQQAVHAAARALSVAEHGIQDVHHALHAHLPVPQQDSGSRISEAAASTTARQSDLGPGVAHRPVVTDQRDGDGSMAETGVARGDSATSATVPTVAVKDSIADESASGSPPPATSAREPEGGLRVIPRFLGNPPPARAGKP